VFNDTVVYTDGLIQVVATSSDVDEDTYTVYYDWYTIDPQTGAETLVQSSVSNELDGSLFAKDEQVYVSVYGDDGLDGGVGTPLESEHITILNTAPQAPTITITPTYPVPESDIVCEVTADSFDLDGDAITYSATWTRDDVSFTSATTTNFSGDTIPSSDLNSGERWVCTVTPNDGDEEGATETAYTTIGGGELFDGDIGASWEILSSSPSNLFSLMTYRTNDFSYLWNASGDYLSYYDPDTDAWDYIDVVTPYTAAAFRSMAPVKEDLWMIRNESVYKYSVLDNTWTTLNTYTGGDDLNMTTSDYAGNVYGYAASGEIVIYNIPTDTVTQYSTGLGSVYETRMTYDPTAEAIFFGAYNEPDLYRFDLDTQTTTALTPIPSSEYQLNNIFCGDRSGHIYVAGGFNNYTMYRYTISSDEWERIPDLPFDHGNNGSCSVSEDGFLYVGTGTSLGLYRISLGMN
ncbi:MAG: kelch repeat-containing protein, partial [Myxococcota bacterium]|nr:kelch repeat-containing protein [Myxococcota bacterium]